MVAASRQGKKQIYRAQDAIKPLLPRDSLVFDLLCRAVAVKPCSRLLFGATLVCRLTLRLTRWYRRQDRSYPWLMPMRGASPDQPASAG